MIAQFFLYFEIFFMIALFVVLSGDAVFFIFGGKGMTLSARFWQLSKQYPLIPAFLGVLFGHLVWQYNPDCPGVTVTGHLVEHHRFWTTVFGLMTGFHTRNSWVRAKESK